MILANTGVFDKYSGAYDEWFDNHGDLYEAELAAVRMLLPSPGARGVEVGVGSGKFAEPLGITTGVEPSEKMAERAKKRGINVLPGVAENLPLSDESFDVVLMVTTICFVDDILLSFQEAFRVLETGGSIIVGFVDKESGLGRQYAEKRNRSKFYKDASFYSTPEVLNYLSEAGFVTEQIKQTLIPGSHDKKIEDGFGKGAFIVVKALKIFKEHHQGVLGDKGNNNC